MKIAFVSNYLTHHQIPFCNEMFKLLGDDFTFIATQSMEQDRKTMGWDIDITYEYELRAYENQINARLAMQLAIDSDVMIIGSAPESYVTERMKNNHNLTFRYSERIYKKGRWRIISPRGLLLRINTYFKYLNKPMYMLCASGYTSGDLALLGSYIGRCYKWGYFPEVIEYNIDSLIKKKENDITKILWVGRFIRLKHAEEAIKVCKRLKEEGYTFSLDIIGNGELENYYKKLTYDFDLHGEINFLGTMKPEEVRNNMEKANIFLSTSDFNEGWGAVINEAMNSACAVIASHAIGSVPFLLQDGQNGLIYQNGNLSHLYEQIKLLLDNKDRQKILGINAYHTLLDTWNAKTAAERIVNLSMNLLCGNSFSYKNGPCSKAELLGNNWFSG